MAMAPMQNIFTEDYIDLSLILFILISLDMWENFVQEARYGYLVDSVLGSVCSSLTMSQRNISMDTQVIRNGVLKEPTEVSVTSIVLSLFKMESIYPKNLLSFCFCCMLGASLRQSLIT